jgi:predicted Rossmann-fold nucleotide-binding protein
LFGKKFWRGLLAWLREQMLTRNAFISPGDLDLVTVTDDVPEAIEAILDYERRVGPPEMVPRAFA